MQRLKKPIETDRFQKRFLIGATIGSLMVATASLTGAKLAIWDAQHFIVTGSPIKVELRSPIRIGKHPDTLLSPVPEPKQVIDTPELPTYCQENEITQEVCGVFGDQAQMAIAIAKAESGLRPDAIGLNSHSADIGLFQINTVHLHRWSLEELSNWRTNIRAAHELYKEQGWNPWTVYNTGAVLAHM